MSFPVLARTTQLAAILVVFGGVAIWAMKDSPWAPGVFLVIVCAVIYLVHRAFAYVEKHPDHALLEGGQLIKKWHIILDVPKGE